jgi:pyridinium-3,5-bisthiocarboxylic acid mononucleotide nickel chelatase
MERVNGSHEEITLAYWDCPAGIAGDMCLGALVDLGVPLEYLSEQLKTLGIAQEYELRAEKVHRRGQIATKVQVDLTTEHQPADHHHSHHTLARHLPTIQDLILQANLSEKVREWSLQIFGNLAIAEAAVHGIPPEKVHFHEVGATDAIVDIVGTCLGLDWLGVEEFYCSPMPTGSGTVQAAHGRLPVPVPAVVKLWESRNVPVYSNGIEGELVTPTGAAIATTLAKSFGAPPSMRLQKIGLGAGTKDFPLANLLRLWIGTQERSAENLETIAVLETQIDDLEPRAIAYVLENLLDAGAVEVFTQPIGLKKSRSGFLLTVLCPVALLPTCEDLLFRETTTLGIRRRFQQRRVLHREIQTVVTPYGQIRLKIGYHPSSDRPLTVQPEYEDCAAIARKTGMPWREIHQTAIETWRAGKKP